MNSVSQSAEKYYSRNDATRRNVKPEYKISLKAFRCVIASLRDTRFGLEREMVGEDVIRI